MSSREMDIAVFPDGPVGFDGKSYRYSKGERLYLDNLAKQFKSVTVFTFAFRPGDIEYEGVSHSAFASNNLTVYELPFNSGKTPGVLGKFLHFIKLFWIILWNLKKYDVSYLFLPSYISAMAWAVSKIRGIPHIVYVADDWEQASESMFKWEHLRDSWFYKLYSRLNSVMERVIGRSARFAVTAGGILRQKFEDFGTNAYETTPRITLVPEDQFFREDTITDSNFTCVHVGALIHDKAQHDLINAFKEVVEVYPKAKLIMIGDGPERNKLVLLAEKLGINKNVNFVGYVKKEDELYKIYRQSGMFVLSSITEGFPRVLYEAMAASLPIVTTNVGSIPFLMKNECNSLIVPPREPKQLAKAMIKLAGDTTLRKQVIKGEQETIKGVFQRMNEKQISDLVDRHL